MFNKRIGKNIAEYQNELISKHCDEVENIYREMRAWRHDYHNHLQVIKAHIASGRLDALNDYIDKLEQDLNAVDEIVKTGNVMLDAIVNSKLSLAKHRGIQTHVKATVPGTLSVTDTDLCVLMGNLLDNALEACTRPKDADWEFESPFVRVYIGMKGSQLYICVTNTVYGGVQKSGGRFLSLKRGAAHGYGLARVDKVIAKYGGWLSRNSEPGAFSTEILLPLG